MCGIWFSVGFEPPREVIDIVAHRGPDGSGWESIGSPAGPITLAHRRLSIIDVGSGGHQPMCYRDRWWITYNGEIYNYVELRAELSAAGWSFRTSSDTEVILAAYAKWGPSCLDRFVGMFAFVIYDSEQHSAFAARDRFGIKPLYFTFDNGMVAVASEIKQLLVLPGVTGRVNYVRAFDFLTASMSDHSPDTMFAGIHQLRGGEAFQIDCSTPGIRRLDVERWYRLPMPGSIDLGFVEAKDRFLELLDESVQLHLRSDVRVGSCLSGGLDSSSLVCLAERQLRLIGKVDAFTTVTARFSEKEVDERRFADSVTRHTGLAAAYVFPKPEDLIAQAEKLSWHQDEPFGSTSIFAQYSVFQEARHLGIKVMLDGQGADEQLAGYHWMFPYYYRQLLRSGDVVKLMQTLIGRHRLHGVSLKGSLQSLALGTLPQIVLSTLSANRRQLGQFSWLSSEFREPFAKHSPFFSALAHDGVKRIDGLGELCTAQIRSTNLPALLHYEDRCSMAHGIEARVPFLDHRLVEFSTGLGGRHKMDGAETKSILRAAMDGIIPSDVQMRHDKLGFATPESRWMAGPLRQFVSDRLALAAERFPMIFDRRGLTQLASDVSTGRRAPDFTLWRIASFGTWGDVFKVSA